MIPCQLRLSECDLQGDASQRSQSANRASRQPMCSSIATVQHCGACHMALGIPQIHLELLHAEFAPIRIMLSCSEKAKNTVNRVYRTCKAMRHCGNALQGAPGKSPEVLSLVTAGEKLAGLLDRAMSCTKLQCAKMCQHVLFAIFVEPTRC